MTETKSFIDLSNIESLCLNGKGGKEKVIKNILTEQLGWFRKNKPLYDFYNSNTGEYYEFKKQQNFQWFDPSKYFNLNDEEKQIKILFCLIDDSGKIEKLFSIKTSDFISRNNWNSNLLKSSNDYITNFKSFKPQIKIPVSVKEFYNSNKDTIDMIYEK